MLTVLEFLGFRLILSSGTVLGNRTAVLTFDVENDLNLSSFHGLEIGLPKILQLMKRLRIPATFFVTGEVAEKYPTVVRSLSDQYEVACHGYHHESLQKLDPQKISLIKRAKKVIEEVTTREIIGFRAPYLRVSPELFDILKKVGFRYDSSLSWFNVKHWSINARITEFRLMFPNVFFRFPFFNYLFERWSLLQKEAVFYFHPWEAVDVRSLLITRPRYLCNIFSRPDRWLNSGRVFLSRLSDLVQYLLHHGFQFKTLANIYLESVRNDNSK